MNQKVFSESIRKLRTEKGYTSEQVADMLGISPACLYRWEYCDALSDSLFDDILNKNY